MALEEFDNDELNKRDRGYARMRSIMDLGMGLLWTAMGVFLFFNKDFVTRVVFVSYMVCLGFTVE